MAKVSQARRHFARLFGEFLAESTAIRPKGWEQADFARRVAKADLSKRLKCDPPLINHWLNGKSLPFTAESLDLVISVLWRDLPGFEPKKAYLRGAWARVSGERHWGNSRSSMLSEREQALQTFFISDEKFTRERMIPLLASGSLTSQTTTQVVKYLGWANEQERKRTTNSFLNILLEPTSLPEDQKLQDIIGSVLSKYPNWRPSDTDLDRLGAMCEARLKRSWETVSIVSPLGVAMARAGRPEIFHQTLTKLIFDADIGLEDFVRVESFYGNEFMQFNSIMDHFQDPKRKGLIWANDTNTLLRLTKSVTLSQNDMQRLKSKLLFSAKLLSENGLHHEAVKARDSAELIR